MRRPHLFARFIQWRWSHGGHHWHLWPYPRRHRAHAAVKACPLRIARLDENGEPQPWAWP